MARKKNLLKYKRQQSSYAWATISAPHYRVGLRKPTKWNPNCVVTVWLLTPKEHRNAYIPSRYRLFETRSIKMAIGDDQHQQMLLTLIQQAVEPHVVELRNTTFGQLAEVCTKVRDAVFGVFAGKK